MSELLTLSLRLSPATLQWISFFRSLRAKLVTIGEVWNVDRAVNRGLRLPAQLPLHHNGPVQRLNYCRRYTILLELSNSLPTRREHSTVFRQAVAVATGTGLRLGGADPQ